MKLSSLSSCIGGEELPPAEGDPRIAERSGADPCELAEEAAIESLAIESSRSDDSLPTFTLPAVDGAGVLALSSIGLKVEM